MEHNARLLDLIQELRNDKQEAMKRLTALDVYLTSPKFHQDTTVQVNDILHRISEVKAFLL